MEEFNCKNCEGKVVYTGVSGWGHIIATGCVKPAVSMEDWKKYLKLKKGCHNCKWKYSCGYTGCLNGRYTCSQGTNFKKANGKFWSFKEQKEVDEETARKHFLESEPHGIVEDDRGND